ncbi:MAG: polysaccharide deacetylase family protein [Bacteroidetes bacterium]|jgi:hypothetical protein|nr:polysaccharide deacetylase family protein [Bacteroidota bacterium]
MMNLLYPLVPYRDSKPDNEDYCLQLTQQQIRELALSKYTTIGSPCYYHNGLARINIDDAQQEMIRSRQYFEDITGETVNSQAFPYGSYNNWSDDHAGPAMREHFTANPFINTINPMCTTVTPRYE